MFNSKDNRLELRISNLEMAIETKDKLLAEREKVIKGLREAVEFKEIQKCSASVYFSKLDAVAIYRSPKRSYTNHGTYGDRTVITDQNSTTSVDYISPDGGRMFQLSLDCDTDTHEELVKQFNIYKDNDSL